MEDLCCGSKKKHLPGHPTNFQKSIDQNQSFFYSWPMYADDSSIDCSGDTIIEAQTRLQSALNKASTWFAHNRLVLNTNKSSLMLISHFKNPLIKKPLIFL